MRMLHDLIDRFQAKFPPNRLVALAMGLLLPTVITPAAAFLAVWVPAHFPGLPTFTAGQLTAYGVLGGSAALLAGITAGYKYIDGWQKHERGKRTLVLAEIESEMARAERENKLKVALASTAASPEHAIEAIEQAFGANAGVKSSDAAPPPGSPAAAIAQSAPPHGDPLRSPSSTAPPPRST